MRPIDVRPLDSTDLLDSEAERAGIGENFCQPPLLLPPSRAVVDPLGLAAEFELPRASALWPKRWDPLLDPMFELPFPGLETSRLFPVDLPFIPLAPRAEKKC